MRGDVLSALRDPATYADGVGAVVCHETHGSWVFVAGERAIKVKKPVVLSFLDYGTLERRRAMCREEVRLNRRLAPDFYLGTVAVVPREGGGFALDEDDEAPDAVAVAVVMRRYDEADTLSARLRGGCGGAGAAARPGRGWPAFHAAEPRLHEAERALAGLCAAVRTTLDDHGAGTLDAARVRALRSAMEAALAARRQELRDRGRRGRVVAGHGDLRAEHVLLTEPLHVVDALEFDAALGVADVACDLGFLVMDHEGAGAHALDAAVVEGLSPGRGRTR